MGIIQLCFIFGLLLIVKECSSLTQSPPRIVKQPPTDEMLFQVAFQTNENPKPFIIECEAEGEPAPKYRWIKNGKKFDWQAYDDRISQQPGRGTLVISLPRDEDLGQYQCFAENEWGTATSNSVFVRKSELNSFKDQPRITLHVNEGEPLKVECRPPDGWPKPKVNWMMEYTNGIFKSINNSRMTVDPEGNLWFSNVTRQDSSEENFSYACTATSHFRSEYKVGNRVLLKVEKVGISAALNKHEPVQQYVTRKNEVVLRGKQVELFCIFGGTPLPEIVWSKDGRVLTLSDRVTQENYGKTLVIKHANFEDQGSYTCDASNGVGSAKSYSISLKVMAVPYFTVEPEIKNAAENETVEIKCEASGVPTPQIKWIHNGKPIVEAPPNDRRVVGSNSIIIRKLEKSDTGNYGCNATNSLGYVYKDVYINVLAQPPEISEPPGNVYTVDGRNVEMKCHVFGAPKPIVKWIREGREMTGGRYTVSPLGDLLIKDVNFQDVGEYTCLATNKFGEAKEIGTLTVKEHTRITDEPEDYEVAAGTQATFRCNAVTDPSLNVSIEWLYDGQPIDFEAEPRFVKTNDHSLTITRTTEQDSGTYTCEASTDLDNATAQATLTVQDVPNPPKLESIECLNREAKLSWRPMGDSRAPILRFIIQYNTSFTPDTWETAFDSVPATDLSYNVGLSPWANYTFRVAALNKIGPSLPSHHSDVCTTAPDVPYKNPDNVEGKGTEPNNMIISWTPMPQIEHNAPRFQYRIYYKRQIPGEEWITEDIFDWTQSELQINNLPTYQPYDIKVVAINQKGQSNVTPVVVTGYSGEDKPTQAPTNFTLVQVTSSNAALLSWNPVPPESIRGHFKGYKIETWTAQGGENNMREIHVKADANKTLVMKFVPFARNYARILAYNGRFDGPPSETLSFETPEGRPGTVADFQAYPMGSSALFLIWSEPTEPNGILTGYKIYYSEVIQTALGTALERKPQITDPRQTRAKLAGLKPNTKYRVTISATTNAGEGDPYFLEETTRSGYASAPDIPIFTLSILPATNGLANVLVTWLPSLEGRSGSHFNVKYRIKGEPEYISTPSELAENWIILRGLFPGEVYEVVVVAYDGEYFTESPPQEVDTSGVEGPIIQVKENVASAGWFIGAMLALAFLLLLLVLVCVARRNRGGKYDVHDRELANGRHDFVDEGGFHEYSQPLDNKSRHSMSSGTKHPESDTDSMAEYGEGETGRFTEDGSFIGQYVPGGKALGAGLGTLTSAPQSPNASVRSPQPPTYV